MHWEPFIKIKLLLICFLRMGDLLKPASRLALITVIQFLEELPDRQAADAVRGRIDLKYALSLELSDPGFDFTLLSDFRKRLIEGEAEQMLLDALLTLFKERGWLKPRQKQRTDSTHVLAKIRAINRLMCVGEAMRFALNSLAVVAPDWLLAHSEIAWLDRYGHRTRVGILSKKASRASSGGRSYWSRWLDLTLGYLRSDCPSTSARHSGGPNITSYLGAKLLL